MSYVIDQVIAGSYTAQDLKDFTMVGKGGAALAPINADVPAAIPEALATEVADKEAADQGGHLPCRHQRGQPPGSTIPDA